MSDQGSTSRQFPDGALTPFRFVVGLESWRFYRAFCVDFAQMWAVVSSRYIVSNSIPIVRYLVNLVNNAWYDLQMVL